MKKRTIINRQGAELFNYSLKYKGKEYNYVIQAPTFEQVLASFNESVTLNGRLNMAGAGKVIFELCCLEHDEEFLKNPRLMLLLCLSLYDEFVLTEQAEIKKK